MTSKERLLAAINGRPADHVPLTTWCLGFPAPKHLQWETNGRKVSYWYSQRLEHIHTLPQPWTLEDEFRRAQAWLSLGIDDVLEVSVPWGEDPAVVSRDRVIAPGESGGSEKYPVLVREYETPSGRLVHATRQTGEEKPGWPVQPAQVMLFEDYNVARAVQHLVIRPGDVPTVKHLFLPPDARQRRWFADRVARMKMFADQRGLLTQAWSGFGIDAAVWLSGTQGAVMMAMDAPEAFGQIDGHRSAATDYARTELAAGTDGVDMVCQRGWYSSTDFWSPRFVRPVCLSVCCRTGGAGPSSQQEVRLRHDDRRGAAWDRDWPMRAWICSTSSIRSWINISLERARDFFGDRMTLAGGTNALSLAAGDPQRIRDEVRRAIEMLGPTNRFILHPVDAIFPDTPWSGVEQMIEAWKSAARVATLLGRQLHCWGEVLPPQRTE